MGHVLKREKTEIVILVKIMYVKGRKRKIRPKKW